jgi:hypothetical protein
MKASILEKRTRVFECSDIEGWRVARNGRQNQADETGLGGVTANVAARAGGVAASVWWATSSKASSDVPATCGQ